MTAASRQLPKGQRPLTYFPRIGLPRYVARRVSVPAEPSLRIGGEVALPCELPLAELGSVPRRDQVSDLHCVITWSRLGLRWGGWALRDVYEQLIVPRARPSGSVRYLKFVGADGFYASLALDFALADDVLLADALDGEPLPLKHGAPLRLVAHRTLRLQERQTPARDRAEQQLPIALPGWRGIGCPPRRSGGARAARSTAARICLSPPLCPHATRHAASLSRAHA